VDPEHPGGQAAPASPEIEAWLTEAMPSVAQLFAAAHRVTSVLVKGVQATSTAGDKVAVAAGNSCEYLAGAPTGPLDLLGAEIHALGGSVGRPGAVVVDRRILKSGRVPRQRAFWPWFGT
jgi:hypothetical protein